ncbi:MAG: hypothetical protein J6B75_10975 [Ruminococcus sp.]|nr:hypothetical protein [Ruminococcus sp.]MBO5164938.1 hypothetical protein [Ruminococcus sp.]
MEGIIMVIIFGFIFLGVPAGVIIGIVFLISSDNKTPRQPQNPMQNPTQTPQYSYQPVEVKPPMPRKKLSASTIMLLIGTAFIILSAVTFVAANWVKMEPGGRIFALAGAAALAFGVSGVMKAAAGLERTSVAFYMIGSLVSITSFATAGYYKIFGSWFSFFGDGKGALLAVIMLIAAAASFIGFPIYKNTAFHYSGFSFISGALIFICVQLTDTVGEFAVLTAAVQLIITALVHMLKPQKGTSVERPVVMIGDISAVIFEFISITYVLFHSFNADIYTFAVLGIVLAQLIFYGIYKKQSWMFIFSNIIGIYTAFTVACRLENEFGKDSSMLFFALATMAIYIINVFSPKNQTAVRVISFIGMVVGAFVSLLADNSELFAVNLIVPAAVTVSLAWHCMSRSRDIQTAAGLALPIMPFISAVFVNNRFNEFFDAGSKEIKTLVYGGLVLIYIAMAAFYLYMPKFAFELHAHHPLQTQTVIYSVMTAAALVLLFNTYYTELFLVIAALCILHFIVSYSANCNITAIGSVISLVSLTDHILRHYFSNGPDMERYCMFALFVLLIIASRVVFPEALVYKSDNRVKIDVLLLSSWTAALPIGIFNRTSLFLRLMSVAVFLAGFIKRNTKKDAAAAILSISVFFTAMAAIARPFLNPDSSMINSKITLAIMVLSGVAYKYIWRNHKEASKTVSTIVFVLSFVGLIFDGLIYGELLNRIFVLAVTAGILVLSFYVKSKTWFTASSISLVIMTIVSTKKYFNAAGWWVYLLAVGIIFIIIAAVNESCKKKGETMKSTVSKKFSDWTW